MSEQALAVQAAGLHGYKLHPKQHWREDIAACQAVRKAVGDDFNLMLDSRSAYDLGEAVKVGRAIEELGFRWYGSSTRHRYLQLCKAQETMDIPVMATEFPAGWLDDYAPWIMNKATDILRGDVMIKGGITSMLKIAHLAEAFAMKLEIHHGGNSMNDVANLHIQMAIPTQALWKCYCPMKPGGMAWSKRFRLIPMVSPTPQANPGWVTRSISELVEREKIGVLS